jgi:hypothetical protein
MTPSQREHLRNQIIRIDRAEARCPVENAFGAIACLSDAQLDDFVARYNGVFGERHCTVYFSRVSA